MASQRRKILFIAEAVTLAHVARPLVLARSLDPNRYEVHFACAPGYDFCFQKNEFIRWPIHSISSESFMRALAKGSRLYDEKTLAVYVADDLQLLDRIRPDMVVGDFRLSLAVSAALRKIPYAAVTNAHWSPYSVMRYFPLPDVTLAKVLGVTIGSTLFKLVQPVVFKHHARPLNALRRRHGLPVLKDLRDAYTHGDYSLYADLPMLVPTRNAPPSHRYIGPILWSPDIKYPEWWDSLPQDKPCVYLTLGSSGQVDLLPMIVKTLASLSVTVMVATAGRLNLDSAPKNVRAANYLPGSEAAQRSQLVICNGGSATAYQALAEGVPVLGIAWNMDQHLTMAAVQNVGAGILLRAGSATPQAVLEACKTLLENSNYRVASRRMQEEFGRFDAGSNFQSFIQETL